MARNKTGKSLKNSPFIEQLKSDYYVICPKDILFGYPSLTMQEKFTYLYLIQYGLYSIMNGLVDDNGNPIVYASQERLAKDMAISQSTVSRYVKKLVSEGLVSIHNQGNGTNNYTTVYSPNFAKTNAQVHDDQCTDELEPMHGCIEYKEKETVENETQDANASPLLKISRKSQRKTATEQPSVDDILAGVGTKKPRENLDKPPTPKWEKVHDRRNSNTLLDYYCQKYSDKFSGTPIVTKGKDLKLMKDLITAYGYDSTVSLVDFAIDHYPTFKRDKGIRGYPTVAVVYGFRTYLEERVKIFDSPEPPQHKSTGTDEDWF